MDEQVINQKIKAAYAEPQAPESLVEAVILRANAVVMGLQAQKKMSTALPEEQPELVSLALVGQLAAFSPLPKGSQPAQLAQQLREQPQFSNAIRGGNLTQRLTSGELIRQLSEPAQPQEEPPQIKAPELKGPVM